MAKWTEYNPETGVRETNDFDEEGGRWLIRKEADVEPVIEHAKALANAGATDDGIKRGLWHYASIPLIVQYKLLTEYGINMDNREHWPRMLAVINSDFPYLKTTHKNHAMKGSGKIFAAASTKQKN